jgi:hypothetical protein
VIGPVILINKFSVKSDEVEQFLIIHRTYL